VRCIALTRDAVAQLLAAEQRAQWAHIQRRREEQAARDKLGQALTEPCEMARCHYEVLDEVLVFMLRGSLCEF
jgi:hypothetical protein